MRFFAIYLKIYLFTRKSPSPVIRSGKNSKVVLANLIVSYPPRDRVCFFSVSESESVIPEFE